MVQKAKKEIMAAMAARRKAKGLVRLTSWVPKFEAERIKAIIEKIVKEQA